jgi:hypothetical protein
MDAGVVSGSLHPALNPGRGESLLRSSQAGAGKLPSTLRVTAARS